MFERTKAEFIQIIQGHLNNLRGGISQNLIRTFRNIQGDRHVAMKGSMHKVLVNFFILRDNQWSL
jgi:hypothetical protein